MEHNAEADKEVSLLERVLLRFAMAEEGEQLEKAVASFLVLTIDKLASPHEATRNKVLSVLTHVNKRVKGQHSVKLPLSALLAQYLSDTPLVVKNINIIYTELAFERATTQEQNQYAAALLTSLSSRPEKHQSVLLRMFLVALKHIKVPENEEEQRAAFPFVHEPSSASLLLEFLLDFLLLTPPAAASASGEVINPGLSAHTMKKIIGTKPISSQDLLEYKIAILKFLSSGLFQGGQILLHFIIASCDSHHSVISLGEEGLRKMTKVKLEDKELVDKMFHLFQGTPTTEKDTAKDLQRPPVVPALKERLLVFMSKSELAANHFPQTLQVIFESIFGEASTNKVKMAGLLFVQWVFAKANEAQLRLTANLVLSSLLKSLSSFKESAYTPVELSRLKGLTYTSIASLAPRKPELFQKDLSVFKLLSEALSTENESTRSFVQEALVLLTHAYYDAPEETLSALQSLLLDQVEKPQHEVRNVAVQYANRLFPFDNIPARYICIVSAGDSKLEIKEEASRGLQPYSRVDNNTVPDPAAPYPSFLLSVLYIDQKLAVRMEHVKKAVGRNERNTLPLHSDSYEEMLSFLRACLKANAKKFVDVKAPSSELRVDGVVPRYLALLRNKELPTVAEEADALKQSESILDSYRALIENGVGPKGSAGLHHVASTALLSWMHYFPEEMGEMYCSQTEWLLPLLYLALHETREICAKILAYAVSWTSREGAPYFLDKELFVPMVEGLLDQIDNNKETNIDNIEGASNALGYIYARCLQSGRGRVPDYITAYHTVILEKLFGLLSHRNVGVTVAAARSIGNIARFAPLPIPDRGMEIDEQPSKGVAAATPTSLNKEALVAKMGSLLKSPTAERRLTERVAIALAFICLGEPESSVKDAIRDIILGTDIHKNDELHFTIGEALSCIGAGNISTAAYDPLVPEEEQMERAEAEDESSAIKESIHGKEKELTDTAMEGEGSTATMKHILQRIFEKAVSSQATIRSSACIWLLSLVKHTSRHSMIKSNLATIQVAFSRLLSDSSDVTQEVAARGLALVYELGDPITQEDLVKELVNTLSTGKTKKSSDVKIDRDSEVLPEGALGSVPESIGGGSLSTYKEICSVASELGQPDLIYRFMNMASHNALWNSRKGAAFAARTLASKGGAEAIKPFLPVLVPKLYRYSHDPNPRLANSMKNILETLTGSKRTIIDEYFPLIMKELLDGMVSNVWRQRESSCIALSNLIQGRRWEQVGEYLEDMWVRSFRAMDDIKESVRKAGKVVSQSVSNLSLRLCDPAYTSPTAGQQAINVVLSFLLKQGLLTQAKEVRSFAVSELLKVCKVAGKLLKPHIPVVVYILIESLSSLEPQAFNYLAFHVDNPDVLEHARLTVSKMSPLNDTLDLCAKYVDASNISELCSQLAQLIQHGVGMPTKCGAAHFIVSLVQMNPIELKPSIPNLLKVLKASMKDKSPAVRTANAQAIASLTKWATERSMKSLMEYLWKLYTESESDEIARSSTGFVLLLTARGSSVLKDYYKTLIPLVLLGRNDPSEEIAKIFKAVWDECGIVSGLQLYLKEVVESVQTVLGSKSWNLKMQGAKTLRDVSLAAGNGFNPYLSVVLPLLVNGLSGRTWKGKEALLIALAAVCKSCKDETMKSENQTFSSPLKITKLVLSECQRKDKEYKRHALDALISLLATYPGLRLELFDEVRASLFDIAIGKKDEDEEEEEEQHKGEAGKDIPIKRENPQVLVLKAKAFEAMGNAWPEENPEWQKEHVTSFIQFLLEHLPLNVWNVQLGILNALRIMMERLHKPHTTADNLPLLDARMVEELLNHLWSTITAAKYSDVRKGSLEVLMELIKNLRGTTLLQGHKERIREELDKAATDTNIVPLIKQILFTLEDVKPS